MKLWKSKKTASKSVPWFPPGERESDVTRGRVPVIQSSARTGLCGPGTCVPASVQTAAPLAGSSSRWR